MERSDFDLSARVEAHQRLDGNGEKCALIKVYLPIEGAKFEGSTVGNIDNKSGEYWVYVTKGTKFLRIKHPHFYPIIISFNEYMKEIVEGGNTYTLSLSISEDIMNIGLSNYSNNYSNSKRQNNHSFQKALQILQNDNIADKKEAVILLKGLAQSNVDAKNKLAYCYQTGLGVELDYEIAADLYKEGVKLQNPEAMVQLAIMYMAGAGVIKNVPKAISLLKDAAEIGSAFAMVKLGEIYKEGELLESNYEEAFKYYKKAAEKNYPEAYYGLGSMYQWGWFVELDIPNAIKYYLRGAELGCTRSMNQLGMLYSKETPFERKINLENDKVCFIPDTIHKDLPKAIAFFRQAIEKGNAYAMNNLSTLILDEKVTGFTKEEGFSFLKKSAEMNNPIAQLNLSCHYFSGGIVDTDRYEAFKWIKRAADNGQKDAVFLVAQYLELGWGTIPDIDSAISYLQKASEMDHTDATFLLGLHYDIGLGVAQNTQKALIFYKKAATPLLYYNKMARKVLDDFKNMQNKQPFLAYNVMMQEAENNNVFANWLLGYIHSNGITVNKDIEKAVAYYDKASQLGDIRSKFELASIYCLNNSALDKQIEDKVTRLIKESAEAGFAYAEFTMGIYYENGFCGFHSDKETALKWYEKAIKHGYIIDM